MIISKPVLSTFSGIGMLDSGFTHHGFCVVSAPEKILGGDIRNFHSIPNVFQGVIGGSPCQDYSKARRCEPTGEGDELIAEFGRVVVESNSDWFLLENVPQVPNIIIEGYYVQRISLCPTDIGYEQRRRRHFQFGSKAGWLLDINYNPYKGSKIHRTLTASEGTKTDRRTFEDALKIQGLPVDLDLPDFHKAGRYRAVGNGVHTGISRELARAIKDVIISDSPRTIYNSRFCDCGCGRILKGKEESATSNCRKRKSENRNKQPQKSIFITQK